MAVTILGRAKENRKVRNAMCGVLILDRFMPVLAFLPPSISIILIHNFAVKAGLVDVISRTLNAKFCTSRFHT